MGLLGGLISVRSVFVLFCFVFLFSSLLLWSSFQVSAVKWETPPWRDMFCLHNPLYKQNVDLALIGMAMFNCPQVTSGHARVSILKGTTLAILSVAINSNEWRIPKERHWANLTVKKRYRIFEGGSDRGKRFWIRNNWQASPRKGGEICKQRFSPQGRDNFDPAMVGDPIMFKPDIYIGGNFESTLWFRVPVAPIGTIFSFHVNRCLV